MRRLVFWLIVILVVPPLRAQSPQTRKLGTVTNVQEITCPDTTPPGPAPAGAVCYQATVNCTGLEEVGVILAVTQPTGTPVGTVIMTSGNTGSGFLDAGFVGPSQPPKGCVGECTSYLALGFRVVQVAWDTEWQNSAGAGLATAACRTATLFKYIWSEYHHASTKIGFCGQGLSGGSAQFMYAMTQYGFGGYFDYLVIAAGPAISRMDYGCDPPLYTGGFPCTAPSGSSTCNDLCPQDTSAWFNYASQPTVEGDVNVWENTTTCGNASPSSSDITKWETDSIVGPETGAQTSFPDTKISFFTCCNPANVNVSAGQGYFINSGELSTKNNPQDVNCSVNCSEEEVWQDPVEFSLTESEMMQDCVPEHEAQTRLLEAQRH